VNGGTIEAATARALQAQTDATTAYNALAGQACTRTLTGQDLGGLTLTPGTYCFSSSAGLTGTLTLDAQGDPAAAFVFQIGSTLTTASGSSVRVVNGGTFCDVYWQVGSSATLGTDTRFMGSIIALTSITMTTGASLSGRAVARNAAVTLDSNTISAASCRVELDGGTGGAVNSGGSGGLSAGGALGVAGSGAGGAANAGAGGGSSVGGAGAGGVGASDAGCSCDASCGCQAGTTSCEAKCVDLQTDSHHCGSCDRVCGASESCISGVCCSGSRATKP
jgi:hypothetical protein